jgi:hypothetical protein
VISRALGALVTGPLAFFLSGLLDVLVGLRLAALYLYRTRVRSVNR